MGKTIKKNQTSRTVRGSQGSRYIVRGKTYAVEFASSQIIAEDMASHGYRSGASVRWNGSEYKLQTDPYGEATLEKVALR